MSTVGRNDPCPCGSGKKYKHCCLRAHVDEDGLRVRLRTTEGDVVPALFRYGTEAFGLRYIAEAWQEFFLWDDVPENFGESKEFGTTFDAFFAFEFIPDAVDPDEDRETWPTEPLALHRLHHAVETTPGLQREFIEQSCRSPASLFAIESATPGRSLDVRDMLTGRRFRVLEQSASRTLKPGHVLYTRVVTAGGGSIFIGASPWAIPASWQTWILDVRESINRRRLLRRADLFARALEIRQAYLTIVNALLHPEPPVLQNTDGDLLELTTLTYELDVAPADAIERLTPLATLDDEVHIADEVHDSTGALGGATLTWLRSGNRKHKAWDNTVLGTFTISGRRLVVGVNSARRRRKAEKEISRRLGAAARLVDASIADMADVLRRTPPPADEPPSPEVREIEAKLAQHHWESWFDRKIPALGNQSPRQAAGTARGRERLDALLAHYGHHNRGGPFDADIGDLKRKLWLE